MKKRVAIPLVSIIGLIFLMIVFYNIGKNLETKIQNSTKTEPENKTPASSGLSLAGTDEVPESIINLEPLRLIENYDNVSWLELDIAIFTANDKRIEKEGWVAKKSDAITKLVIDSLGHLNIKKEINTLVNIL